VAIGLHSWGMNSTERKTGPWHQSSCNSIRKMDMKEMQ